MTCTTAKSELCITNGEPYTSRGVSTVRRGASRKPASEKMQGAACLLYGHGGPHPAPPHPFIRPAFDGGVDEAYEKAKQLLGQALDARGLL